MSRAGASGADLVATFGLDDAQFRSGYRRALTDSDRDLGRWAGQQQRTFDRLAADQARSAAKAARDADRARAESRRKMAAFGREAFQVVGVGIAAGIGAATIAIDQYAERFGGLTGELQSVHRAWDDLVLGLGRDLFNGPLGAIGKLVEGLGAARRELSDAFAFFATGGDRERIDEINTLRARAEAQDREARFAIAGFREQLGADARLARAEGRVFDAERLDARAAFTDEKARIAESEAIDDATKARLLEIATLERDAKIRDIDQRERAETRHALLEREEAMAATAERWAKTVEDSRASLDGLVAAADRAAFEAGADDPFAVREARIRDAAAARRGELRALEGLTPGERDRGLDAIAAQARAELDAVDADRQAEARAAAGAKAARTVRLADERELLRIRRLQLEGETEQAERARIRLDYERQRRRVAQDELLTTEQRLALLDDLNGTETAALAGIGGGDRRREGRRLAGIGLSATVLAQTSGSGAGVRADRVPRAIDEMLTLVKQFRSDGIDVRNSRATA